MNYRSNNLQNDLYSLKINVNLEKLTKGLPYVIIFIIELYLFSWVCQTTKIRIKA